MASTSWSEQRDAAPAKREFLSVRARALAAVAGKRMIDRCVEKERSRRG